MDSAETTRRWMTRGVIALAVLTLVGVAALWPRGGAPDLGTQPNGFVDATVTDSRTTTCEAVEADALTGCQEVDVEITSGANAGDEGVFLVRDTDFGVPMMSAGDKVVLLDVETSPPPYRYAFSDFQRTMPMWWLLALFAAAVVFVGRWQGIRALVGLAASGLILIAFIVPSLIRNESAVLVALVGTIAIAYLALYLAHGINTTTSVALAGTLVSLVIIVFLALGVLDDVTVTQVSTVAALRRANPSLDRVSLYREAITVGRDHVASTVNTLVLAYAGAALPLVLLFSQGSKPIGRILTSEIVAVEIVRMLVGSIGLILAVPITTALAAAVLTGREPVHAGHDHGHSVGPDGPAAMPRGRRTAAAVEESDGPPVDFAPVVRRRRSGRSQTDSSDAPEAPPSDESRASWDDFGPDDRPR
jgi:uncharacterized membrane protein